MQKILKNKKILIGIITVSVLIIVGILMLFIKNNKQDNENEILEETTYTMYVKINPLVKLVFKEITYKCEATGGICTDIEGVVDYELLNDDGKEIYKDIDFRDKGVFESVGILCDIAREHEIAFKSIDITTDYKFDYDEFKNELENNSKYELDFNIIIDIKELINENELFDEDVEVKTYNVTFDSTGGSNITSQTIKENGVVLVPKSPTKSGYTFVEWQLNGTKYDFNNAVKEDIVLKAKWKKNSTSSDDKTPVNNEDKNNNNSGSNDNNNNNQTNNTVTPTKPKSTPDNINLNDNILVEYGSVNNSTRVMVFADDIDAVLAEYKTGNNFYTPPRFLSDCFCSWDSDCPTPEYTACLEEENKKTEIFNNKLNSLTYNNSKAQKVKNEIVSYLSNQKGVINIEVNGNPQNFDYSYSYLFISSENVGIDDFTNSFNSKYRSIRSKVSSIIEQNGASYIENGGYGGGGDEPVLLDETICNKYNLTCSRW